MHNKAFPKTAKRGARVALGLLLACGLLASNCQAQWLVHDAEHAEADAASWVKQWAQWKQQFDQWEQQYFTMLNVVKSGPAFLSTGDLEERGLDDGLAQRCPSLEALSSQIAQQQSIFCKMLLEAENGRYNVLVRLNKQIAVRNEEMQAILASRITQAASSNLGALNAFNAEVRTFQASVDNDVNNAKAALDQYESLIKAIKEQQAQLTGQALKSSPPSSGTDLLGAAIQGVTLKAALEGAKHW